MILNVSGRCDIVAFFSDWFLKRIAEGYVDVRNPFNKKLISRIYMDDVDLIFFCTKNPTPILNKLDKINKKMYFHITVTPYKKGIEPNVPDKKEIIESIKKLSSIVGKDNIAVRYDPVFISDTYSLEYHKKAFEKLCALLDGYVDKILISFLDEYKNVKNNQSILNYKKLNENDYKEIGLSFSKSAFNHHLRVHTCFEEKNLIEYGFVLEDCLSRTLAFKLTGKIFKEEWKARKGGLCHCVKMVDIGDYNCCRHYCKYCYANYDEKKVNENFLNHYDDSSLLIGRIEKDDIIKIRKK